MYMYHMCVRLIRTCNDDVCASCMMYVCTCMSCMYVNKYSAFYEGSLRTHNEPLGPGSS